MSEALINLLGNEIQTTNGIVPTATALADKKVIGIYFSAHWCGPCRAFTPMLSTFYEDLIDFYDDVEIVFVSSDKEDAGFNEYWSQMNFPALPYVHRDIKAKLVETFGVEKIPCLVFVDAQGQLLTKDGVKMLNTARGSVDFVRNELIKQ
ncbi:nucleoredoxin [Thraustotheca clavata]|uniref:protein-disulfide reductase n=1 Tax=Thraustotheca clavata TaxID=74557 RepID=A0A1V9YV59_9STRA|nr:nucleoredoxin [Thraustotheca clavata]